MSLKERARVTFGISLDQELTILLLLFVVGAGYLAVTFIAGFLPNFFIPLLIVWLALSLYLTWRIAKKWMGW